MEDKEIIEYLNHYLDDEIYVTKCVESHTKAILALEKQIPKKIITVRESCCIPFGKCPHCQVEIDKLKNPFYHTDKNCLQLIEWE